MAFFRGKIFPNLFPLLFQAKKMSVVGTKDAQQLNPYSFGCSIMTHQLQHWSRVGFRGSFCVNFAHKVLETSFRVMTEYYTQASQTPSQLKMTVDMKLLTFQSWFLLCVSLVYRTCCYNCDLEPTLSVLPHQHNYWCSMHLGISKWTCIAGKTLYSIQLVIFWIGHELSKKLIYAVYKLCCFLFCATYHGLSFSNANIHVVLCEIIR